MRRLLPVLVPLFAALAVAAPVPKDFESKEKKLVRLFGTPHVPDGSKIELDRNVLKVTVPLMVGETDVYACPRTARPVSGDFEFTVTLTVNTPADGPIDAWAGVYVGFDDKHHFDYMRWMDTTRNRKGPVVGRGVWSQLRKPNQSNVVGHPEQNVPTATLRVIRKGDELEAHAKYGNGGWSQQVRVTVPLPKEVIVGVYAGGRKGPLTAAFEDFKVSKLAK